MSARAHRVGDLVDRNGRVGVVTRRWRDPGMRGYAYEVEFDGCPDVFERTSDLVPARCGRPMSAPRLTPHQADTLDRIRRRYARTGRPIAVREFGCKGAVNKLVEKGRLRVVVSYPLAVEPIGAAR